MRRSAGGSQVRVRIASLAVLVLLLGLVAMPVSPAAAEAAGGDEVGGDEDSELAPLIVDEADGIDDTYIVVLDSDPGDVGAAATNDDVVTAATEAGATVEQEYSDVLVGFTATMDEAAVEALRAEPGVAYIEQDAVVSIAAEQPNSPWGLDRIDQRDLPLDGLYTYYQSGAGVDAYIIDTGVLANHTELGGRVVGGADFVNDGGGWIDCHGHGSHVAGTVGSETYGVAKDVDIYSVRVLNCQGSGTVSAVIAGMDWTATNASGPSVANLSLGGPQSAALDAAADRLAAAGVVVVAVAGNLGEDACRTSPAASPAAITVAATDRNDARASFSNYGSCVDIFAPGVDIESLHYTSPTATQTISGTSMASPHVAGTAALYLEANPSASPAEVANAILDGATPGVVSATNGSPNLLLYSPIVAPVVPQTGTLEGSVANSIGDPVAGIVVDVFTQAADGSRGQWLGDVTSGGGGAFTIEVDAGCYVLTFIAPQGDNFVGTGRWLNVPACVDGGQTTAGLDAVIEVAVGGPGTITGTVTTAGSPVQGVTVDLFVANADGSRGTWLGDATTDATGSFTHTAPAGCYVLTFIAPAGSVFDNGTPWHQPSACVEAGQLVGDVNAVLL